MTLLPVSKKNTTPKVRVGLASFLSVLLLSGVALAGDLKYSASHVTSKSPDQVLSILTDYPNICSKGCKYQRDDLVVVKKVSYLSGASEWYTWSHVKSTMKDVTFFTHVKVQKSGNGTFTSDNRQLGKNDAKLIAELEKKTGLKHAPAFDEGNTHSTTQLLPEGKTKITQTVTLSVSGMLAMWEGKILDNMKKSLASTFALLGK